MATRTVHDPFLRKDVQISGRLVDRLRGKYASGPHLPNGKPEFGWRQFESPPIQHEAAARIEELEKVLRDTVVVMQAELASASCLSQTLHALDAAKAALGEKQSG